MNTYKSAVSAVEKKKIYKSAEGAMNRYEKENLSENIREKKLI